MFTRDNSVGPRRLYTKICLNVINVGPTLTVLYSDKFNRFKSWPAHTVHYEDMSIRNYCWSYSYTVRK